MGHCFCSFTADTNVDAWGSGVTAACFISALTGVPRRGCAPPPTPGRNSTLFLYMNGHGAEGLLKFRDNAELTSAQFALALLAAKANGRFSRALLVLDTCHAESILQHIPGAAPAANAAAAPHEDNFVRALRDHVSLLQDCPPESHALCAAAVGLQHYLPQALQGIGKAAMRFVVHWLRQWDPPNAVPVPPLNVDIIATSSWHESSYAAGFDPDLGTPLADGFVTTLFRRTLSPRVGSRSFAKGSATLSTQLDAHISSNTSRKLPRAWRQDAMRYFMGLPRGEVGSQLVQRRDHGVGAGMRPLSLGDVLTQQAVLTAQRAQSPAPA